MPPSIWDSKAGVIMNNQNQDNLSYYNANAESFYSTTVNADMSDLYVEFTPYIPENGHILDFGCGSGRDSLYFLNQGYNVTAIDGSKALCKLAKLLIHQPIRCQDFLDFEDQNQYDGIWACASLLHIPERQLPEIISKLHQALKPNGILYASFKYGRGERQKKQRHFTDLDKKGIQNLFNPDTGFKIQKLWLTEDVREDRSQEKWINMIAGKSR